MVGSNDMDITDKKAGNVFRYWRGRLLGNRIHSRINIQLVDLLLYPEQMTELERFVAAMRDILFMLREKKVGKSEREIEKLDAWAFFEISETVKDYNERMNHKLADKYPMLVQYRNQEFKKTKDQRRESEKVVKLVK